MAASSRNPALKGLNRWIHIEPLLAVVLWGGVYSGARFAVQYIPVLSFSFLRLAVAAILLAGSWLPRRQFIPRGLLVPLLNAGIAQAVFQLLAIASLRLITAGEVAILLATSPILTAGWLVLCRRGEVDRRRWAGLLVGLIGVGLVTSGAGSGFGASHLLGDLLALCGAVGWVWFSLAVSPLVGALGMWPATARVVAISAFALLPVALPEASHEAWWRSVPWAAWAALFYAAAAGGVMANALWGWSMHRLGSQQTMVYAYLEPVSAVIIAAVILGESLSGIQATGALLTLFGVWLASPRTAVVP